MNEDCTLPSVIANAFNQHFVSSVAHITSNVQVCEPNVLYYETTTDLVARFGFEPVTECFVNDDILKMDSRKATGNDNISCRLLKLACPIIAKSLTCIINMSLCNGCVPYSWKSTKILPLHKSGDTNFSVTSVK